MQLETRDLWLEIFAILFEGFNDDWQFTTSFDKEIRNLFTNFTNSLFTIKWREHAWKKENTLVNSDHFIRIFQSLINFTKTCFWDEEGRSFDQVKEVCYMEMIKLLKQSIGGKNDKVMDLKDLESFLSTECPIISEFTGCDIGQYCSMAFVLITKRGEAIYFEFAGND